MAAGSGRAARKDRARRCFNGLRQRRSRSDSTILFRGKEVTVKPNSHVTVVSKWSEVRRSNDPVYVHFNYPTIRASLVRVVQVRRLSPEETLVGHRRLRAERSTSAFCSI